MSGPNINQRLNGLEPLAYAGVNSVQPPDFYTKPRDPGPTDSKNFYLGSIWLNTANENVWMLVSLVGNVATWVMITGAGGAVTSIATQDGHFVTPLAGVIILDGGPNLTTTGTIGPNTATISLSGITQHSVQVGGAGGNSLTQIANGTTGQVLTAQTGADPIWTTPSAGTNSFPTDSGTATPSAGVLNIKAGVSTQNCGSSVEFTGSSNTVLLNVTDANDNTVIGKGSGSALTSATNNTFLGQGVATSIVTGTGNFIAGKGAGSSFTLADSNSVVINGAGQAGRSGLLQISLPTFGTVIHNYPGTGSSVNGENYFFGLGAGNFTMNPTGTVGNIGIGGGALASLSSGVGGNIAIGDVGMALLTTGIQNTGLGKDCFVSAGGGTGLLTGNFNIALGFAAGSGYTGAESSNILIGPSLGGTAGESNVLRIGNSTGSGDGQLNQAFIAGIRGITTVNNNAITVLIDSAGQLGTTSSSRTKKDNIVDMGSYSDSIRSLRPVVFNYKEHIPESKSVGLIAEEVADIAPHLVVYKDGQPETVKYHDLVPMLLNEFQKHCALIASLQAVSTAQCNRIRLLEEEIFNKKCCK